MVMQMSKERTTGREQSCDSDISEDSKRKREGHWDIFSSSKKTYRPPQKNQASTEVDDLKSMMIELLSEVKGMKKEQQEFSEKITQLKKENRRLNERVVTLENRITMMEREGRKKKYINKRLRCRK